jgi:hypothetical protein
MEDQRRTFTRFRLQADEFDRVSPSPHALFAFQGGCMDFKGKNFAIAVTLTVLDLVVACRYGTAVWQASAEIIWCRLLLLLFVTVWVTCLADLWRRVGRTSREAPRHRRVRQSEIVNADETEGADV